VASPLSTVMIDPARAVGAPECGGSTQEFSLSFPFWTLAAQC